MVFESVHQSSRDCCLDQISICIESIQAVVLHQSSEFLHCSYSSYGITSTKVTLQ